MSKVSFMLGFISGLFSVGAYAGQMEPVAYLYNGVRLPKLPEGDKYGNPYSEEYPYMVISKINNKYYFTATTIPLFVRDNLLWNDNSESWEQLLWYTDGVENSLWKGGNNTIYPAGYVSQNGLAPAPLWSSYKVLNEDGSVYLAASDPIPVYE